MKSRAIARAELVRLRNPEWSTRFNRTWSECRITNTRINSVNRQSRNTPRSSIDEVHWFMDYLSNVWRLELTSMSSAILLPAYYGVKPELACYCKSGRAKHYEAPLWLKRKRREWTNLRFDRRSNIKGWHIENCIRKISVNRESVSRCVATGWLARARQTGCETLYSDVGVFDENSTGAKAYKILRYNVIINENRNNLGDK